MTEPKKTVSICPKCDGNKVVRGTAFDGSSRAVPCDIDCPVCNGEGVVWGVVLENFASSYRYITEDDVKRAIVWAIERDERFAVQLLEEMLIGNQKPEEKITLGEVSQNSNFLSTEQPPRIEPTDENLERLVRKYLINMLISDVLGEVNKILAEQWEKGR